jgi:hypothetical protein
MPLAGSLDISPLLPGAPRTVIDDREVRVSGVEILQVLYEVAASDLESLVPPALNPTLPPVVMFLAYQAADSEFGPFSLVQVRLTARSGVRPRGFLVSACCDNAAASEALAHSYGYRITPANIRFRRLHHLVDCAVSVDGREILDVSLVDPEPITGHDIQYAPGMHLAQVEQDGELAPRIVQVDSEYEFHRADRGRPTLTTFDAAAWGNGAIQATGPVSASYAVCDVVIHPVRYICNPDLPAHEGTVKIRD